MCLLNVQLPSTSIPILKSSLESIKIRSIFYKSSCVVQTTHFEGVLCPDILNHNLIVPRSQREFKFAGQAQSILHEIPNAVFFKLWVTTHLVGHTPIPGGSQIGPTRLSLPLTVSKLEPNRYSWRPLLGTTHLQKLLLCLTSGISPDQDAVTSTTVMFILIS